MSRQCACRFDVLFCFSFWVTLCKMVCPVLLDRCLSVCLSVTLVYCDQTVGWIKTALGREVGLGLGDIVLDGDPPKGAQSPSFWPM